MARTPMPLDFKTADHRDRWIEDNADYFTLIRRQNLQNMRLQYRTKAEAEEAASAVVKQDPEARLLIYAVHGTMTAYIKTVAKVRRS